MLQSFTLNHSLMRSTFSIEFNILKGFNVEVYSNKIMACLIWNSEQCSKQLFTMYVLHYLFEQRVILGQYFILPKTKTHNIIKCRHCMYS